MPSGRLSAPFTIERRFQCENNWCGFEDVLTYSVPTYSVPIPLLPPSSAPPPADDDAETPDGVSGGNTSEPARPTAPPGSCMMLSAQGSGGGKANSRWLQPELPTSSRSSSGSPTSVLDRPDEPFDAATEVTALRQEIDELRAFIHTQQQQQQKQVIEALLLSKQKQKDSLRRQATAAFRWFGIRELMKTSRRRNLPNSEAARLVEPSTGYMYSSSRHEDGNEPNTAASPTSAWTASRASSPPLQVDQTTSEATLRV